MHVTVTFHCEYCGDKLGTEQKENGMIVHEEFHECFGETPGFIANVGSKIITADSIRMEHSVNE